MMFEFSNNLTTGTTNYMNWLVVVSSWIAIEGECLSFAIEENFHFGGCLKNLVWLSGTLVSMSCVIAWSHN